MNMIFSCGMNWGWRHQALTKNSRSSSSGTSLGLTTSICAHDRPRMVCAVAALRACRGTLFMPTRTVNLMEPALAIDVLLHGRQTNESRAPGAASTRSLSA